MLKKKLIFILTFIVFSFCGHSIVGMAAQYDEHKPNLFHEMLADELHLLIFTHCFDDKDIYDYFSEAVKTVKVIRRLDKNFERFTKSLINMVKRIAWRRFLGFHISRGKSLEISFIAIFDEASKKKMKNEIIEDKFQLSAAQLIIAGVDLNNINMKYYNVHVGRSIKVTILQFIARTNLFIKLIPILVVYGLNINAQDILGNSALHLAVYLRHQEVIKLICECGGNTNIQNNDTNTVFHFAIEELFNSQEKDDIEKLNDYKEIIQTLLFYSDLDIKNKKGETALDLVCKYKGDDSKLRLLKAMDYLNAISQNGNDPNSFVSDFIGSYLKSLKK